MKADVRQQLLHLGARVRIDVLQQRLWRDGVLVKLRPKAWQALVYLLQRPGQLVTGEDLLDALWHRQDVSAKTMANLVSELRTALGDDQSPPRFLMTVHRRGYRLLLQPENTRPAGAESGLGPSTARVLEGTVTGAPQTPEATGTSAPAVLFAGPSLEQHQPHAVWVGRTLQMLRLQTLLAKAVDGQRHLALVTGDPGVGKTALLDRFVSQAGHTTAVVARGACFDQTSAREAFAPVLSLVAGLCSGPLAEQTMAALQRCAPSWLVQMPWLMQPHDLLPLRQSLVGMGQGRMLREFAELVNDLAQHAPLLLVIEDLHWADPGTVDLLQLLAGERRSARLLLVASYQPALVQQTAHPVMALARQLALQQATEIRVDRLAEDEIMRWIELRFGSAELARQLCQWAEQQSMGIPLYLAAASSHLVDSEVLVERDGQWQLTAAAPQRELAEPLRRLIVARLARLDGDARRLLDAASVVGMRVPVQQLAAALGRDTTEVELACSQLVRQGEFVRAAPPEHWPDGSCGGVLLFHHDIYRRALYEDLAPGLRRLLYQRSAERLEAGWGDQVAAVAGELAVAYAGAAMPEATARVLEVSAQQAALRLSYGRTIEALRACLEQLAQMPSSNAKGPIELRVQLMLGTISLNHLGVTDPATRHAFEQARVTARRIGAEREEMRAQLGVTSTLIASFRVEAGVQEAQRCVAMAEASHPTLASIAHYYMGLAHATQGQHASARAHMELALGLPPDPVFPLFHDLPSAIQVHLGRVLCLMGQTVQGIATLEAGVARARTVCVPTDLMQKLYWAADAYRLMRMDRAVELLGEIETKGELFDLPGLHASARLSLACAVPPADRDTQGIESILGQVCHPGDHLSKLMASLALTEAHLAQGHPAAGRAAWALGREVTPAGAEFEPEILRLHAALLAAEGASSAQTEACLREALARAQQQSAGLHALRSATDLCRHLQAHNRAREGQSLLAQVLAGLEDCRQMSEQADARRLLESVSA